MKICTKCFRDNEIKNFIINSGKVGTCECCGGSEDKVIDITEFSDFFGELLSLFEEDNSGKTLYELIQDNWELFNSCNCADMVLQYLRNDQITTFSINTKVRFIEDISESFGKWDDLKHSVKNKLRFFTDVTSENWDSFIMPNYVLQKGKILYRARILPDGIAKLKPKEMGCPPPEKAIPGRANPLGIPYLYLCTDKITTLYETRSVYLDRVCIGSFRTIRNLNIVNFNESINIFYAYGSASEPLSEIVKHKNIIDSIRRDLSKPMRRFDTEIEYIPTQLICEYCKLNGADGIIFASSLYNNGDNVVLFNPNDAKCTKVNMVEVTGVNIESEIINK